MHLTIRSGGQQGPERPASFSLRDRRGQRDMSFLEMLDVVNEDLIRRARSLSPSTATAAKASAAPVAS